MELYYFTICCFFYSFFFWAGHHDSIACSLLGGIILSQNSGYRITRLCPYCIMLICSKYFSTFLRSVPSSSGGIRSAPLHSYPLGPLTPPPPHPSSDSTSDSEFVVVVSAALPFAFSRSIPSCSHHRCDTLTPSL